MPACRICRHTFKCLKFQTEHIDICTRCVNTLNESPEPASKAQTRLAELLARGMHRNAERDLKSSEEWRRRKARWTLDNFDAALAAALPDWITKLLANPKNSTRDFKIMRAHRRGLLRMDGFSAYPGNWAEVARNIRRRDDRRCTACGDMNSILDVHHIIYLSKHGTNQQHNLITLCRPCHQAEHDREFDWPEAKDPESISPIQLPPGVKPSAIRPSTALPEPAPQRPPASLTPKTSQQPSPTRATPVQWEAARAQLRPIQAATPSPSPQPDVTSVNRPIPPAVASNRRFRTDVIDLALMLAAALIVTLIVFLVWKKFF